MITVTIICATPIVVVFKLFPKMIGSVRSALMKSLKKEGFKRNEGNVGNSNAKRDSRNRGSSYYKMKARLKHR